MPSHACFAEDVAGFDPGGMTKLHSDPGGMEKLHSDPGGMANHHSNQVS